MKLNLSRGLIAASGTLLLSAVISFALAQAPAGGGEGGMGGGMAAGGGEGGMGGGGEGGMGGGGGQTRNPADQAVEYRQALFTVIGGNFTPIGAVLQGRGEFNGASALKSADRTAQLAAMVGDAFPDVSKTGANTKASPDIWTNRAEFDKIAKDFADHTAALAAVLKKDNKTASAEFKTAATAVAGDCKGCHDKFRAK